MLTLQELNPPPNSFFPRDVSQFNISLLLKGEEPLYAPTSYLRLALLPTKLLHKHQPWEITEN